MMRFIKEHLISEFEVKDFADMYAQTLVYGLFAARYNDETLESFSRQEARDLVPATNPFLKSFFDHISGSSFPKRLEIIVDELCEVFSHADVKSLMEDYFKQTNLFGEEHEAPDPVIHFYEDFLREYNPKKKMEMGVFYTPLPVVRFIVRGIDDLLKREFDILDGLADSEKIEQTFTEEVHTGKAVKNVTHTEQVHRVQVLDVAVGTGTFLNETLRHIYEAKKHNQGHWEAYVNQDLLPRLHGFELMMASYTIAHLKLAMTMRQTGVKKFTNRLGVYLSNTLDTPHEIERQGDLFGVVNTIAEESNKASEVKHKKPIMVILGNPPYSGESQNPHYTGNDVYKVEPGGKQKLKEKNSKWLNDDYVKFIRFAESMVEKNGEGVIGMITAHGYIDNPTFRGMRWHLRKTFNKLYVLDLHGNSNKKETAPDGSEDKNVFDIKTGVAIVFGVLKRGDTKEIKPLATVFKSDLYGKRAKKFMSLNDAQSIDQIDWVELPENNTVWYLEGEGKSEYEQGFSVSDLFSVFGNGIVTKRDFLTIDRNADTLWNRVEFFVSNSENEVRNNLSLPKDVRDWQFDWAKNDLLESGPSKECVKELSYRPFDKPYIYYTGRSRGFIGWPVGNIMKHYAETENIGLLMTKSVRDSKYAHVFVTDTMSEAIFLSSTTGTNAINFPLYVVTDEGDKVSSLSNDIVSKIESITGPTKPEDILDYVYAVLHSPAYRQKFEEFLKNNYPHIIYPANKDYFWKLVECGKHLRELHLLSHSDIRKAITTFPESGDDTVVKPIYKNGRVYINTEQYWEGVPKEVWDFYVGGYQPAQKYLKDRKDKKLTSEEFANYEKMIVSLNETIKVMAEIDKVMK